MKAKSIRPFIGSKNFSRSRFFYQKIGFEEYVISKDLSLFSIDGLSFYLQDYYVKPWINNSMIFLEIDQVEEYWQVLHELALDKEFDNVKLSAIQVNSWGQEFFLHDPAGVLWHFGSFNS